MLKIVPYDVWHLGMLDLAPDHAEFRRKLITQNEAENLKSTGLAWTGMDGDRVVGCAGFFQMWPGRVQAWALFGRMNKAHWPQTVRFIRAQMEELRIRGIRRIEATVPANFGAGCRLAFMLDFKVEGCMKAYAPDGTDHFLYAKVFV